MRLEKDGINVTEMLISIKEDVASIKAKMSGVGDTDKKADEALALAQEAKTQVNKLEHQFNQVVYIAATAVVLALFVYIIEKFL
jgi:ABC-type hemin transport system substrate-binding protein|nr:MAG TPA: hemolysin [Caudoviricetes sp.]